MTHYLIAVGEAEVLLLGGHHSISDPTSGRRMRSALLLVPSRVMKRNIAPNRAVFKYVFILAWNWRARQDSNL